MRWTARLVGCVGLWAAILCGAISTGQAAEVPEAFDPKSVLEHNQTWLHPDFSDLESVRFLHVAGPTTIKERFSWRKDGSSFLEILERELVREAVGKVWVTTGEPALYYFASGSIYAEAAPAPQGVDRLLRDRLMGSQANCVTLDWGWNPEDFTVRGVRRDDDGRLAVQLVPNELKYNVNVTPESLAPSRYTSKFRVGWAELTIDPNDWRILAEVDYTVEGKKCAELKFSKWKTVGADREVPLRIEVQADYRGGYTADYRFGWQDEGLWILTSCESQYEGKEKSRQEICDLAINESDPALDQMLARVENSTQRLQSPLTKAETIPLTGLQRFQLGKTITADDASALPMKSVLFTFTGEDRHFKWPPTAAKIGLTGKAPTANSGVELLLTFLDKEGRPVQAQRAPVAAMLNPDRTLIDLAGTVAEHNAAWLSPPADLPPLSYTFKSGDESKDFAVDESTDDFFLRCGVHLIVDWQKLIPAPERYHASVQFEGQFDGKSVIVSSVTEHVYLSWSNGLKRFGHVGGSRSHSGPYGLVVVEKETSRPLMSKYGDVEVYYQNYVKLESSGSAPLRIVVFQGDACHDFRFQIVNGRRWLFDRAWWDGEVVSRLENVLADAKPVEITARAPEDVLPAGELPRLDWSRIVDRHSTRADEAQLVQEIIARPRPWEHPCYKALLGTTIAANEDQGEAVLTLQVDRSSFSKEIGYWSLAWRQPGAPPKYFPGPESVQVAGYPFVLDKPVVVESLPGSGSSGYSADRTRIRSCQLAGAGADLCADVEVFSHDRMVGISAPTAIVLIGPDGQIQVAASEKVSFTIHDGIYSTNVQLPLSCPADLRPRHVLLGVRAKVTSAPMGSLWGRYMEEGPSYSYEQLLAADDSGVWGQAAGWLYSDLRQNGLDRRGLERTWRDRSSRRTELLKPHLDQFERLLKLPGDGESIAMVARLAGHSGDKRFLEPLADLLDREDETARDGAATGLGLLGDMRGMDRLGSVLARPMPEDKTDWQARADVESWQTDAAMALAAIGSEEALQILGDSLLETARSLHEEQTEKGSTLAGPVEAAEIMIHVLGRTKSPIALAMFRQVLALPVGKGLSRSIIPHLARWEDKDAVRDLFVEGIRRGDAAFIDDAPRDGAITEALAYALTNLDLGTGAAWHAVRYLGGSPEPIALEALIETFETRRFEDSTYVRCQLIESLAKRKGDYRGLEEAFTRLCQTVDGSTLPEDPEALKREQRARNSQERDLVGLITGSFPVPVVAEMLRPRQESEDPAVRAAVEAILAKSEKVRTALATPPVEFPESVELLSHVGETGVGKQSFGGTGFGVKFARPEDASHAFAIEFYGSRYGTSRAPNEDFHIYLLDENQAVIRDIPIPYSRVKRGNEEWYRFVFPPVEVPQDFYVGLWFNAHQTKGVCIGKAKAAKECFSYTGTLEKGYKPVTDQAEWMIRVRVAPANVATKLAAKLTSEPSEPSKPAIPTPLLASDSDQKAARGILKRLAEVNRYWLFSTPPTVKSYQYEFRFGTEKPTAYQVDAKAAGGATRQGISYYSPLHTLLRDPERVSFRSVSNDGKKIVLTYMLAEPASMAMGCGISGSWRGFFSSRASEGTLTVDAARFVPLEHRADNLHETWSEYARQDAEHLAPRKIDITRQGMEFHWKFKLYEPGLWLFASATGDEPDKTIASISGVRVNGQDAKAMER